jgi:hypothetical protein
MNLLRKRHLLRFSIRTLLVAVTIFCVWLAWQVSIVRERRAVMDAVYSQDSLGAFWPYPEFEYRPDFPDEVGERMAVAMRLSFVRRMMGDVPIDRVECRVRELLKRVEDAFPEAEIWILGEGEPYRRRLVKTPEDD